MILFEEMTTASKRGQMQNCKKVGTKKSKPSEYYTINNLVLNHFHVGVNLQLQLPLKSKGLSHHQFQYQAAKQPLHIQQCIFGLHHHAVCKHFMLLYLHRNVILVQKKLAFTSVHQKSGTIQFQLLKNITFLKLRYFLDISSSTYWASSNSTIIHLFPVDKIIQRNAVKQCRRKKKKKIVT